MEFSIKQRIFYFYLRESEEDDKKSIKWLVVEKRIAEDPATSLKDLKTKADIDAIYLDRGVDTIDEVRDTRGKKALPNNHGEVILFPGKTQVIDINKSMEEQISKDGTNNQNPGNPPIAARRMKGAEDQQKGTDKVEQEWIAAY